jgi:hypothetical protein
MRRRASLLAALTTLVLFPPLTRPATTESHALDVAQTNELIGRLARPAPATVAFTEVRLSPLLQKPLVVSGELGYSGPASLDRRVTQPYRELTTIRGESVRVEREGQPARSFALKRAPELRGLLNGFSSLLNGDANGLRADFKIDAQQSADGIWGITMTPLDPRAAKRVKQLDAVGRESEPSCFTLTTADKGVSVMLLGAASRQPIPEQATVEQLNELCKATTPAQAGVTQRTSRAVDHRPSDHR